MAKPDGGYELTEEVFDVLAPPLVLLVGLTSLEAILETLTDIDDEVRDAFAAWSPAMRDRAATDLRKSLQQVRDVLDDVEAALPELPNGG